MASNIPIIVQGNSFSLAIPLQIYYINGDQMDLEDYTPDPTDEVSVQLKGSRRNYTYTPTIDGNVANIDLSGNELADNYSVVVSIVKANGQRLRSFRTDQFFIVESSDDLTMDDIIQGLEENVIYLNSQAFVAGEDGRGIESIVKTSTAGLVDTYTITYTDGTTSTFNVTNGARGDAIYEVEQTPTDYDMVFEDGDGYVLAEFSNGHIKTKNFDSSNIGGNEAIQKAVFMGDSITHGVYSLWHNDQHAETDRYNGFDIANMSSVAEATAYHGIHYFFGKLARCTNVVNLGKRGTGYVADTRHLGNALVVATNYNFSDVDFVALCFGVNDYIQGKTIGDITTQASGTIIGNMCATIEKILTDNPLCKVVVYSPYNTWGQVSYGGDYTSNVTYGDETSNYALGHTINGNTLQDIINAEEIVCNYYGIQHVNLSKSNVINRFTIKNILIDGLHPSKESYIKLAAEIYGKGNFGD
jgi:lysophospholipase L1-like esterase